MLKTLFKRHLETDPRKIIEKEKRKVKPGQSWTMYLIHKIQTKGFKVSIEKYKSANMFQYRVNFGNNVEKLYFSINGYDGLEIIFLEQFHDIDYTSLKTPGYVDVCMSEKTLNSLKLGNKVQNTNGSYFTITDINILSFRTITISADQSINVHQGEKIRTLDIDYFRFNFQKV